MVSIVYLKELSNKELKDEFDEHHKLIRKTGDEKWVACQMIAQEMDRRGL